MRLAVNIISFPDLPAECGLERYSLEDITETLYNYTNVQASLAKVLEQKGATNKWERQAEALHTACEMLDEVYDDELCYLIY